MLSLEIPHVDAGHTTLKFDLNNAEQKQQAESQINDLIRQGYSVFIEADGKTDRITKFDPNKDTYLLGSKEIKATPVAPPSGGCAVR